MGGFALSAASSLMGYGAQRKQVAANNKAVQQNMTSAITSYNYNYSNQMLAQHQDFENTITALQETKKKGSENLATVQAALGESIGGEGRTAQLLQRQVQSATNDATNQIQAQYKATTENRQLSIEQSAKSTNNQLQGLSSQFMENPSVFNTLLSTAISYGQYRTQQLGIKGKRESAGITGNEGVGSANININPSDYFKTQINASDFLGSVKSSDNKFNFKYQNPYIQNNSKSIFGFTLGGL